MAFSIIVTLVHIHPYLLLLLPVNINKNGVKSIFFKSTHV